MVNISSQEKKINIKIQSGGVQSNVGVTQDTTQYYSEKSREYAEIAKLEASNATATKEQLDINYESYNNQLQTLTDNSKESINVLTEASLTELQNKSASSQNEISSFVATSLEDFSSSASLITSNSKTDIQNSATVAKNTVISEIQAQEIESINNVQEEGTIQTNLIKNQIDLAETQAQISKEQADIAKQQVQLAKDEVAKISNVYKFKGSVANFESLPSNADNGDVYDVLDTGINYAWTGTKWDELGGTFDVSGVVHLDSEETITGAKTFTKPVKIQNGQGTGCMWVGANVNSDKLTNNNRHLARISTPSFSNVDLATTLLGFDSSGDSDLHIANKNYDAVSFGGQKKITNATSPMSIGFCVTNQRESTSANNKVYALELDAHEARFNVQPNYNGITLATTVDLETKQNVLTAGENITIENGVISASGGGGSDVVHLAGAETITGAKTFTGAVNLIGSGDSNAVGISTNTRFNVYNTGETVLGFGSGIFYINHADYRLRLRGKDSRPHYNSDSNYLALLSDIPDTSNLATKTELEQKQDTLTAGENITIEDGIISATGGGMPIGTIYTLSCTADYVPEGSLPTDGAEYTQGQFNDLWDNYLATGVELIETDWAIDTVGTSTDSWYAIAYGNGRYIAVGSGGGNILTSTDGETWSTIPFNESTYKCNGIAYGNGKFIAVSDYNRILTSTDGETWTTTTYGEKTIGQVTWKDIAFGNGRFVISGSTYVVTSTDGVNWTEVHIQTAWQRVTYINGKFVALAGSTIGISTDGINWTKSTVGTGAALKDITYGGGKFITVGKNGFIATSTDCETWTIATVGTSTWNSVTYGDKFVVVGEGGSIGSSIDGINWTISTVLNDTNTYGWNRVVRIKDKFVALGTRGTIASCTYKTILDSLLNTCTYSEYESDITNLGQCSRFGVDINNKTFRVPFKPAPERYFVVVANGSIDESKMDWAQWASSLQGKANVDGSNWNTNLKQLDGQWVGKNAVLTQAISAGTTTIDMSDYLPNDGHNYEVFCVLAASLSASSQYTVYSDIIGQSTIQLQVAKDGYHNGSYFTMPVGVQRKMYFYKSVALASSGNRGIEALAYRRIGTNV